MFNDSIQEPLNNDQGFVCLWLNLVSRLGAETFLNQYFIFAQSITNNSPSC